jgi:hypothetical protein
MEVEVFKTDIEDPKQAKWIIDQIEKSFANYKVNFDLEDCDRILRVEYEGAMQTSLLIDLLRINGCNAEVLPDTIPSFSITELVQ